MKYVQHSLRLLALNLICIVVCSVIVVSSPANGQDNNLQKLLSIRPRHNDFDYDHPTKEEIKGCKIQKPGKETGTRGYVVIDGNGRVLRQFLDNNSDDRLDQWSYFKDGIEVYRDLDTNFDNKADQHRWMGTAGIRWGLDKNQDGSIDVWRMISAEEVASEVFEAIKSSDSDRFQRVLISQKELKGLGLGEKLNSAVSNGLKNAVNKFDDFVKKQELISKDSNWVHFGTSSPSLVPAGNSDSDKDVIIYDHASAVFRNGNEYEQVALGTVVQVGPNSWRIAELPQMVVNGEAVANGGILFPMPNYDGSTAIVQANPEDEKFAKLFGDLDVLDKKIIQAKKQTVIEKLEAQRARLYMDLIEISRKEERVNWIESLADKVTDAYQNDRYPQGLTFLLSYQRKLEKSGKKGGLDYISWRLLNTKFSKAIGEGDRRTRAEANEEYMGDMEDFVGRFEASRFTAECLHNLGMHYEISDVENPERAIEWYKKCAARFPDTDFGKKCKGAVTRLTSVGKRVKFVGKTMDRRGFNLSEQNKIVVVHFWETQNQYCIDDFDDFQRLAEKYKGDVLIVGANVDMDTENFKAFMKKNSKVRWTQLHEPGGVEGSSLAHQLGPASLPLIILFDSDGKLVETGIAVDELDREIQRLLRKN